MITWNELKTEIIDLGFEEDDVLETDNYERIIINAVNRALRRIYTSYVPLYESRLESVPTRELITFETEGDYEVTVPEEFEIIVPLLSAHYVWLDDDIQKATMYWNEVDNILQEIGATLSRPKDCRYVGGW